MKIATLRPAGDKYKVVGYAILTGQKLPTVYVSNKKKARQQAKAILQQYADCTHVTISVIVQYVVRKKREVKCHPTSGAPIM